MHEKCRIPTGPQHSGACHIRPVPYIRHRLYTVNFGDGGTVAWFSWWLMDTRPRAQMPPPPWNKLVSVQFCWWVLYSLVRINAVHPYVRIFCSGPEVLFQDSRRDEIRGWWWWWWWWPPAAHKRSPLKLSAIFSLVVTLCNWKLSWLLRSHIPTFTPIIVWIALLLLVRPVKF